MSPLVYVLRWASGRPGYGFWNLACFAEPSARLMRRRRVGKARAVGRRPKGLQMWSRAACGTGACYAG
eukprot:3681185-Lingulodinium_polyedra.AAC.1